MSHRILHAIAPAATGGAERVVQMLAAAQKAGGDEPLVAGVTRVEPDPHPFFLPLQEEGVATRRIAIPGRAYIRELREWRRLLDAWNPGVVHTHGYRADVLAGRAAARARIPVVSTAHGFIGGDRKGRMYERIQIASYRRGRHVIAVSRALAERLVAARIPAARVHVLPNALLPSPGAVDREKARARLGLPRDAWVVGWVGRLGREKGPDVMLEALPELPEARLSFVGDGALREDLAARASALGVTDRVTFHGTVLGAGRWLKAFDALALSSRSEGTPITLLEAMDAGVPVVASRVGGVPDLLDDGSCGLLVRSEAPSELAAALARIRSEPELVRRLTLAAHHRIRDVGNAEVWVERHAAVYEAARRDALRSEESGP